MPNPFPHSPQTDAAREALQATRRLYGERMSGLGLAQPGPGLREFAIHLRRVKFGQELAKGQVTYDTLPPASNTPTTVQRVAPKVLSCQPGKVS